MLCCIVVVVVVMKGILKSLFTLYVVKVYVHATVPFYIGFVHELAPLTVL